MNLAAFLLLLFKVDLRDTLPARKSNVPVGVLLIALITRSAATVISFTYNAHPAVPENNNYVRVVPQELHHPINLLMNR